MYNGAKASSVIAMKSAIDEYINQDSPSITKIASKYKIDKGALSRRLKSLGIEIINHQNKATFDEFIFDSIDTEEKAYWLGFIFADGTISSTSNLFELSLKASDVEHLNKFNLFMKCTTKDKVKINKVSCGEIISERCRWHSKNSHLKQSLIKLGCVPNKSLILMFPDKSIFKDESLIRHFIRGYWDGDGCLTWHDVSHTIPCVFVLGTEDFLTGIKNYLPLKFDYKLTLASHNTLNSITKTFNVVGKNGYEFRTWKYVQKKIL